MTRALAAIDAELMALDRRHAVAILNDAPQATKTRLYWERVHLVREWSRAKELGAHHDASGVETTSSSHHGESVGTP